MNNRPLDAAPDYTDAFLVSAGALLFSTLLLIWVAIGMVPALLLAGGLNHLIRPRKPG